METRGLYVRRPRPVGRRFDTIIIESGKHTRSVENTHSVISDGWRDRYYGKIRRRKIREQ